MLDFGALPPEINSALMYAGPGSGSMLAAAGGWQGMADDLNAAAASYGSVVSNLTSGPWTGPTSASMAAAVAPFVTWLSATAALAQQTAGQVNAAVAGYEAAFAATVPPALIAANRSLWASLVATNFLGQNTPAIAATDAHYGEMWAQDTGAMYGYQAASAAATKLTPFTSPPQSTSPAGPANQAAPQLAAGPPAVPGAASPLAAVGSSGSASTASSLSSLSLMAMPARMAAMPAMMLMRMMMMGGMNGANGAAKVAGVTGAGAAGSVLGGGLSGLSAGTGSLTGLTAVVGGAPAATATAGMGQAASVGALSVPPAWSAPAQAISPAAATLTGSASTVAPAAGAGQTAVPPMMPVGQMAARGVVGADSQYDLRPKVMGRSPIGG